MIKSILISWDLGISLAVALIIYFLFPHNVSNAFVKDLYGVGISVLSIVFSIFFAALAVIISTSDDAFVIFLEEEGLYTHLINTFKFTLMISFFSLIYSIVLYVITSNWLILLCMEQSIFFFSFFIFLFSYSLTSTFSSCMDSIKYSHYRSKYLYLKNNKPTNIE